MPTIRQNCDLRPRNNPEAPLCWRVLTPPGAGAVSLLEIFGGDLPRFMTSRGLHANAERPALCAWRSPDGALVDEPLLIRSHTSLLAACHGGAAVLRAIERDLEGAGGTRAPDEGSSAPPWARPEDSFYIRELAALMPAAQGETALREVLSAWAHGERALGSALARYDRRSLLRIARSSANAGYLFRPPRVQLWGPVNAGKSSLLNALCGREMAAVGDQPGLTRDMIEGGFDHRGVRLRLFDAPGTGLFEEGSPDAEAQRLAKKWCGLADLVLLLIPAGASPSPRDGDVEAPVMRIASLIDADPDAPVPPGGSVTVRDPVSLERLKDRLVEHFFGPWLSLDAQDRFAIPAALRADLEAVASDAMTAEQVARKWLRKPAS